MKNVQTLDDYFSRESRLPEVQRLYEKASNKIDFTELNRIVKESLNDNSAIPYDDYCVATRLVDRWVGLARLKISKIKGVSKPTVEASPQSLETMQNSSNSENVDLFTTSLSNSTTNYELVVPPLTDNSTEKMANNLTKPSEKKGIFGRVTGIVEEARYILKNSDKYDSDGEAFLEH